MEHRPYGMFVVAGVVALGAVGVALLTTRLGDAPIESTAKIAVVEKTPVSTLTDSDGDGVPDWKEMLWGTDPHNPDTDGDGISDGDEIAAGTNPLKAGSEPIAGNTYVAPKALPTSEAIARELFAGYAYAKQDGVLDTSQMNATILNILSQNTPSNNTPVSVYSATDLKIVTNTAQNRLMYDSQFGAIYLRVYEIPENELLTVQKFLETGDGVHVETLRTDAKIYSAVVQELLKISVPSPYTAAHLDYVNALNAAAYTVRQLADSATDPYNMLDAVQKYLSAGDELITAHKKLYTVTNVK